MALSPLVEKMLAQMIQQQGPMLSPLAPVGQMALAAALAAREKRGRKEDEQKVAGLAETLASLTAPGADQFVPQGVIGNTGASGPDPLATAPADILKRTPGAQAGIASMGVPIVTQTPEEQATGARSRLADAYTKLAAGSPDALQQVLMKTMFPDPGEGYTLGEGQTRFNSRGEPVATGGTKQPKPNYTKMTGPDGREVLVETVPGGTPREVYVGGQKKAGVEVNVGLTNNLQEKLGDKAAETFYTERYRKYQDLSASMPSIIQARKLLDEGIFSGTGAEQRLAVARLANTLGVSADPRVTDTDTYRALIGKNVAEEIKNFGAGTGLSDADREFAINMSGGNIAITDDSLKKILDLNIKAKRNIADSVNRERSMLGKKAPDLLDITEEIVIPEYEPDVIQLESGARVRKVR